jgi:hypothetical protein
MYIEGWRHDFQQFKGLVHRLELAKRVGLCRPWLTHQAQAILRTLLTEPFNSHWLNSSHSYHTESIWISRFRKERGYQIAKHILDLTFRIMKVQSRQLRIFRMRIIDSRFEHHIMKTHRIPPFCLHDADNKWQIFPLPSWMRIGASLVTFSMYCILLIPPASY